VGALSLIGLRPRPGEICLDLGSSPGGWTWQHNKWVRMSSASTKRPSPPKLRTYPGSSSGMRAPLRSTPRVIGPVDWLFSDVVCYPARLLALVERWLAAGTCRRFVCTVKFQGKTDHETARRLAAIPGSQLRHLFPQQARIDLDQDRIA